MPYVEFLKPYPGYAVGQVIDLPGRLTWELKAQGIVKRVAAPVFAPVAKKIAAKRATKKAK